MFKNLLIVMLFSGLLGCEATQPEPYQANRAPEDRTEYNGLSGVAQQQRDQSYLMDKELSDRCNAARVDLAVAESQQDHGKIKRLQGVIKGSCR